MNSPQESQEMRLLLSETFLLQERLSLIVEQASVGKADHWCGQLSLSTAALTEFVSRCRVRVLRAQPILLDVSRDIVPPTPLIKRARAKMVGYGEDEEEEEEEEEEEIHPKRDEIRANVEKIKAAVWDVTTRWWDGQEHTILENLIRSIAITMCMV